MPMKTLYVPVAEGRSNLCELLAKAESGVRVIFTSHGKPKAVLSAYRDGTAPWRVGTPDDPARYGDLQKPVLEDWQ